MQHMGGELMDKFGQRVRRLRTDQGISLRTVARQAGISPAYLSRIESGQTAPPTPSVIKALAETLGIEPGILFELTSSLSPDILSLLKNSNRTAELLNVIASHNLSEEQIDRIIRYIRQFILK